MDFFDKHKALIITILFCSVLLLALYNFSLSDNNKKAREFLLDLEQLREEPEAEEQQPEEIEEQSDNDQMVETHRAYNQEEETREENFSEELNEILDRNSASKSESTTEENASAGDYSVDQQSRDETRKESQGDDTSDEISTRSGGIDNSSIFFSLRGRSAVFIPNPVYTCDRSGKIVVNITVNAEGRVVRASINESSSTSNNECLTDQALQYARQAVFSKLPGRNSQPGTITYHFKP